MQNEKNGGNDEGVASILRNPRLRGFGNYAGSSVRARQEEPEKKRTARRVVLFFSVLRKQRQTLPADKKLKLWTKKNSLIPCCICAEIWEASNLSRDKSRYRDDIEGAVRAKRSRDNRGKRMSGSYPYARRNPTEV